VSVGLSPAERTKLLRTGKRCFLVLQKGKVAGLVTPHVMRPLKDLHTVPNGDSFENGAGDHEAGRPESGSRDDEWHLAGVLSRSHVLEYLRTRADLKA
jgi:hypothetical protein